MKRKTISAHKLLFLPLLSLMIGISIGLIAPSSLVLAAGSSAPAQTGTGTKYDKRKKANEYFKQAVYYQKKGQYNKAVNLYEKAVLVDNTYAEAYSNLAYSYRKQGQFNKAIPRYKKAIALKPDLAEAHEYIGEAYAEMGQFDLAENHLIILKSLGSKEAAELEDFIEKQKRQ